MPAPPSVAARRQLFPRPLRPGDRIALVAPASPFAADVFKRACEMLEDAGYQPVPGRNVLQRRGYLAGSEAERAQDLMEAVRDPQIGAIFCVRGGFGSSRLLPWLPFPALRSQAKMLLGYSDITFLHLAFWKEMQWVTYHGPNLLDFQEKFANCWPAILTALHGERPFRWDLNDATILRPGVASGILLGGNLTCLVHLLMTPHFPRLEGALLMLEDHGEALYRLDRMLTQLRLAGIFHGINGLVLGQLTAEVEQQEPLREMILDHVQSFEFPVVAGLPFGHGTRNDVVPLGVTYLLNTYERTLTAQQHPFAG